MTSLEIDTLNPLEIEIELSIDNKTIPMIVFNTNDYISLNLKNKNIWEPNIVDIFIKLIKHYDENLTIFDVGGNLGYFSIISASYGEQVKVHTFEPIPELFNIFKSLLT